MDVVPSCFLCTVCVMLKCCLPVTQVTFVMENKIKRSKNNIVLKNVLKICIVRTPRRIERKKFTHFQRLV